MNSCSTTKTCHVLQITEFIRDTIRDAPMSPRRSMAIRDIKIPESVNVGRNASRSGQRRGARSTRRGPRLREMRFHERIFRWGTNLIS